MRALILLGVAATALSACNGDQSAGNAAESEANVTSQLVATNDTTAIDAATGEAANMAADVDFTPEPDNASNGNAAASSPARRAATAGSSRSRNGATAAEPRASDPPAENEAEPEPDTNTL